MYYLCIDASRRPCMCQYNFGSVFIQNKKKQTTGIESVGIANTNPSLYDGCILLI